MNYEGGDVHQVKEIINNPNYNTEILDYDAALLRLATKIVFDEKKQAIALPYFKERVPLNMQILVSGWGSTMKADEDNSSLRAVVLSVSATRVCHETYIGWYFIKDCSIFIKKSFLKAASQLECFAH